MIKTKGSSRLTAQQRKELMVELCRALCSLTSPQEVAEALTDLLSPKETETIAKRLQIAQELIKGAGYQAIRSRWKVGFSTIARINTWLNLSGEGYKIMFSRKQKESTSPTLDERYDPHSWHNIKRRYSLNFWPQLILDEFFRQANVQEKEKITSIFEKLDLKTHTFNKRKNKELYEMFSKHSSKIT